MTCNSGLPRLRLVSTGTGSDTDTAGAGDVTAQPVTVPAVTAGTVTTHKTPDALDGPVGHGARDGPDGDGARHADHRSDGDAHSGDAAGGDGERAVMLTLAGQPMTAAQRSRVLAAHWGRLAVRGAWAKLTRPGGIWHEQPPSLADHHAYYQSRAWVPEGHQGRFLPVAGQVYGYTLGLTGVLAGHTIAWVLARPLRLALFLLIAGGITLAVLYG